MLFDAGCVVCLRPASVCRGPVCAWCEAQLKPAGPVEVTGLVGCRAAYRLDDGTRSIIAALKYRRQRRIADWLAVRMGALVPRVADAIVWVPSTPSRRRRRGFDQAQELAVALSQATGVPALSILDRHRDDDGQTGRGRAARGAGPTLQATAPCPDFVVVVDDVVTTGSSVRVAAEILGSAGAARIVGVAAVATPLRATSARPVRKRV